MPAKLNLTGQRFNRLTVLKEAPRSSGNMTRWTCQCDCGNTVDIHTMHLRAGHTKSCGCIPRQNSDRIPDPVTGELVRPPGWSNWKRMISRCYCKTDTAYANYGGRGIEVCPEWRGAGGLARFLKDMGPKPSPKHSIGRQKVDLGYSKDNCRWETAMEQANNKRNTRLITMNGKSLTMRAWDRELGLADGGVHWRLRRGWTVERAFSTPRQGGEQRPMDESPKGAEGNQTSVISDSREWLAD